MASHDDKKTYPNPLLKANCTSKFFFWWLKDIIWYSKTHDLTVKDLYDTIPEDLSEPLTCSLESVWLEELDKAHKRNQKPSLWKVVAKVYCWDFIKFTGFPLCFTVTQLVLPELLEKIMSYFRLQSNVSSEWAYLYGTALLALMLLRSASLRHGFFHLQRLGMHARIACTSLIYKKIIRVSYSANQKMSSSAISLLSMDVGRFELLFSNAPFILTIPLQLLIETYLIWQYVGLAATAAGVAQIILLTFPLQALYSKVALKFRAKQSKSTDDRVSMIGEIVDGMKAVKMYVWENYFEKLVQVARRLEIQNYAKTLYLQSIVLALASNSYRLGAFMVTLTYVLQYGLITADKILPVALHLYNLRMSLGSWLFLSVRNITDMHISMKRIEDFLLLEEVPSSIEYIKDKDTEAISINNVTACWDEKSIIFENISLSFAAKKLYAVVGSVGSGKSSLLKLILRELKPISGKVSVHGKVSYASQEPWLFNGSVRDNILFGDKYNEDRYEKVANACALIEDFSQLPYGDKTLVGDRGSNLSGGQCARINLARAVYKDSDIYLFDNPLSAVDTHVAKKITIDCLHGLLKDKIRILITHSIQQSEGVAEIILLEHGQIKFRGNVEDFQRNDQYITQLTSDQTEVLKEDSEKLESDRTFVVHKKSSTQNEEKLKESEKLIAKEAIKYPVYSSYIKAGGLQLVSSVVLANIIFITAISTFDFGLGAWTRSDHKSLNHQTGTESSSSAFIKNTLDSNAIPTRTILFKFGGLMLLVIIGMISKNIFFCRFALNASESIHNTIFSRMMMTTLQFFEANSAGRILNRFSEDTGVIDSALPQALSEVINMISATVAVLLPAILVNWWILFPCIMSTLTSILIGKLFVRSIQRIKRLAGSAKSPILSFAKSSLAGVTVIRTCNAENMVSKDLRSRQDRQTAAQFLAIALSQGLSFWIELNNFGLLATITYLCIFLKNDATYEGHVGLSLMQVLNMTMTMSYTVRQISEAFAHTVSLERIMQFMELEQETLIEEEPSFELTSSWPETGRIVFEHLYLSYSTDTHPVLWDVNCVIEAGSKVGIVGRTGAGKSSLITALFRFAKVDGSILIDGVDTKSVDLYRLRSKISIIPQEPVLFKGTLRKNLDLLGKFDDASLWSALENVELKHISDSLDFLIERGGSNLSAGQRQLLCLARAILIKNQILILDEVTANVDSTTDALIQKTIRNTFKERTVLTIAHRLDTVMDSDKILVMDHGRVVEYDHPFLLLQNSDSYFFKIVEQTGDAAKRQLIAIAKQTYENLEVLKSVNTSQ